MADYGLNLSGTVRVFRKDKEIKGNGRKTYTVTDCWFNVSERNEDGSYFNKSTNLLFKKDLSPPDNNTVVTFESFPVITGEGNYRRIAYMVTKWEYKGDK